VYSDLALLAGGAEPIAKRARERLEAGAPLEAIELVEVALSAEPQHRGALAVSLAAHEKLAEQTDNFWLLSWLRDQAKTLRTTLEQ
jgi:alkyl sulfatase BDS1-like metallo-beta-lactamase superfamily hydrolase